MDEPIVKLLIRVLWICFIGSSILTLFGGFRFLRGPGSAAYKRKWFPRYAILGCSVNVLCYTTLMLFMFLSVRSPLLGLGCVACYDIQIISLIQSLLCSLRFCSTCGRVVYVARRKGPPAAKVCKKCGADLDAVPKPIAERIEENRGAGKA